MLYAVHQAAAVFRVGRVVKPGRIQVLVAGLLRHLKDVHAQPVRLLHQLRDVRMAAGMGVKLYVPELCFDSAYQPPDPAG